MSLRAFAWLLIPRVLLVCVSHQRVRLTHQWHRRSDSLLALPLSFTPVRTLTLQLPTDGTTLHALLQRAHLDPCVRAASCRQQVLVPLPVNEMTFAGEPAFRGATRVGVVRAPRSPGVSPPPVPYPSLRNSACRYRAAERGGACLDGESKQL